MKHRGRVTRRGAIPVLSAFLILLMVGASSPASGTELTIPFKLERNKVILPVRIGDSPQIEAVLDTGMQFEGLLLYRKELKDLVGVTRWSEIRVGGAGSGPAAKAARADSISFVAGEVPFADQRIVVLLNDAFKNFPSDGVIGYSLFGTYAVEIDYDQLEITLHEPGGFERLPGWRMIPLTFKSNKIPWVDVVISMNGQAEMTISTYVDLASREALELLIFDGMKYELPGNLDTYYLGRGLSGDIHGQKGRIATLTLGGFALRDVATAFVPAEIRSKQPGADGVLGNNALRRFNVVFDYSAGVLYLKPNAHFVEPFAD